MAASVVDAILEAADLNPAAPAILAPGQIIRYERLQDLIAIAARALQFQGVQSGQAVGITMLTSPLHVFMLLGLAALGVCSVPLHPQLSPQTRERLARKFQLAHLITDMARNAIVGVNSILVERLPDKAPGSVALPPAVKADTALRIQMTSGNADEPKGVLLSHRQAVGAMQAATREFAGDARLLTADPHVSIGFYCLLITLSRGGCLVFPHRYDLASQIEAVTQHAVTHLLLSPLAARKLIPLLPPKGLAFPTLRQLRIVGGAPSVQLVSDLSQRATPHLYAPYTLTELAKVTSHSEEELLADPRSAGSPTPGVEVRIVGAHGTAMPAGARGEIAIRRRGMPTEYVNDPQRSREAFRDGWFYTGDLGSLSEDGKLYVEGRLDDVISVGGNKIAPALIEDFLMRHPDVVDAAVIGEGRDGAEALAAVVVLKDRQAKVDLKAHCNPLGARAPARFITAAAIPRNAAGKVMREQLQHELMVSRA